MMVLKSLLLLVCLVALATTYAHGVSCNNWIKLNNGSMYFGGRSSRPGVFKPLSQGFLAAVKLVYLRGKITCDFRFSKSYSNWGCHDYLYIKSTPLNVFVTNENDEILFPTVGAKFTTTVYSKAKWYSITGFDSKSDHLVLQRNFSTPFYIGPKTSLKVWYGEDLFNFAEIDNHGSVLVDVYGYFL